MCINNSGLGSRILTHILHKNLEVNNCYFLFNFFFQAVSHWKHRSLNKQILGKYYKQIILFSDISRKCPNNMIDLTIFSLQLMCDATIPFNE